MATTLVDFQSGRTVESEQLANRILVYIEKDCAVCLNYARTIGACSLAVRNAVDFVSVSTPAQTKLMAKRLPALPLYVAKIKPADLNATPMTVGPGVKELGALSCDRLEKIAKAAKSAP